MLGVQLGPDLHARLGVGLQLRIPVARVNEQEGMAHHPRTMTCVSVPAKEGVLHNN